MSHLYLNKYPSWKDALELLGISADSSVLPVKVPCPLCSTGQITIFADSPVDGQWYHCSGCGSYGGMLDLLATKWKLSRAAALSKIHNSGAFIPPELLSEEALEHLETIAFEKWARYTKFWNETRNPFASSDPETLKLLHVSKFRAENTAWQETGPGQIVAAAPVHDIEACAMPRAASAMGRQRKTYVKINGSEKRIFTGKNWTSSLFFPFYDVPFRISGLCCLGRDFNRAEDIRYKHVQPYNNIDTNPDFGLAFHPEILRRTRSGVFAFRDPLVYLHMHLESFHTDPTPLDIVCWAAIGKARSRFAWRMFAGRKIHFWAPRLNSDLLLQAIQTDGYLCATGVSCETEEEALEFALSMDPPSLLQSMKRQAVHWTERLNKDILKMEDHEIEELFFRMQLSGEKRMTVLSKCEPKTRNRILDLIQRESPARVILIDKHHVEERSDGWYKQAKEGEELISDAILRIDRAIYHPKADKTIYQGRVHYQSEDIPFSVPAEEIEDKPFAWMRQFLIKEQKGLLRSNPFWNNRVITIANQFNKPTFAPGIELIGWDAKQAAFLFPTFRIEFGGSVVFHQDMIIDPGLPTLQLPPPKAVDPRDVEPWLGNTPGNRAFWNAWCALVANIVAPVFNHPTRGIGLTTSAAVATAGAAALSCGCLTHNAPPLKTINDRERAHAWPVVINTPPGKYPTVREPWLLEPENRNCLVGITPLHAHMMLLTGHWHVLDLSEPGLFQHDVALAKSPILTSYLQNLCQRRFEEVYQGNELVNDIRTDVAKWLEGQGFESEAVLAGATEMRCASEEDHVDEIGELIWQLLKQGFLKQIPEAFGAEPNCCWRISDPEGVLLPKADFLQLVYRLTKLYISADKLTKHLEAAEVLHGLYSVNEQEGWLLDTGWWRRNINAHTAREKQIKLKVC